MSPPSADDVPVPEELTGDTSRAYSVGTTLGSYRLVQQIGAGGMGRVFIAEHALLGRQVALKVLRSELSGNIEAVKRFFAEARAVNRIKHENIIEISDFVANARGPSFYIMELLQGTTLRVLQSQEGLLSVPRALRIVVQVCRGVGAAHAASVIHRDLKPDNVFLIERDGQADFVKLLDFGVAKLTSATLEDASTYKTSAGMVVGTPDYMAPEQALGQPVDHRADIYSIGVILFELLVGRRPFVARTAREVMVQHMVTPAPGFATINPALELPLELEDLVLHCLKKDPHERPDSIQDVANRLSDILQRCRPVPGGDGRRVRLVRGKNESRLGTIGTTTALAIGDARRRRWPIAAAAALLIAAGLLAWSREGGQKTPAASTGARLEVSARPASPSAPSRPSPPGKEPPAASGPTPRLTVEGPAIPLETPTTTGTVAPSTTPATKAAHPSKMAAPSRRKPAKLDKNGVVNPFE